MTIRRETDMKIFFDCELQIRPGRDVSRLDLDFLVEMSNMT